MKNKIGAVKSAPFSNGQTYTETPAKTALTTPVASAPASATASLASGSVTTIDIKLDVGFGNAVFLRGQGGGLNWERGVPLACVDGKTWRWSGKVKDPITFKPLINDKIWSAGSDLTAKPGQKLEIRPNFA